MGRARYVAAKVLTKGQREDIFSRETFNAVMITTNTIVATATEIFSEG